MRILRPLALLLLLAPAAPAEEHAAAPVLAPFPLPSPDGKTLARGPAERRFRLPLGYARVEAFYRAHFGGAAGVTIVPGREDGTRTLTIRSSRPGDAWARAVVREGVVDTTVDITPVVRFQAEVVEGRGRPLVQLVLPPDAAEVRRMANSIDHTPQK
jgi:hypothetical protein